jgi:hypothetical protein
VNDSTTPAPIIPPAPPQVGRLVPYWDPGLEMAAAVDNAVARLDAKLVAFDKMTETVTDMALRKTLSELPRSIDRMVSDRHRRAIWQQMLFDAGKVLAGVVVGYLVCFWGAL